MKPGDLDRYARNDLTVLMGYASRSGEHVPGLERLERALSSSTPVLETYLKAFLKDNDWSEGTPHIKRIAGYLMALALEPGSEYGRTAQIRQSAEGNRNPERVSMTPRCSVPQAAAAWWADMTSAERGDLIAGLHAELGYPLPQDAP